MVWPIIGAKSYVGQMGKSMNANEARRVPPFFYSVSRFVTATRNSGFAFSTGSIAYVCSVFAGS